MKLTLSKVRKLNSLLKQKANDFMARNNYNQSLKYLQAVAYTNYAFYFGVVDDEIERNLSDLSKHIKRQKEGYSFVHQRCVFYDSHSWARGGLTQQYIRAIMQSGWEMLYITEVSQYATSFQPILKELEESNKVQVTYVPQNLGLMDKAQFIYDAIVNYSPQWLFMHYTPKIVHAPVAFHALPSSIERYLVNFTDHTFWAGRDSLDYCLEFRTYGCNLSLIKREIDKEKIFLLPFYPIEDNCPFEGFPFDEKGKIVVFSGGSYYKTFDNEDTYYKICKKIIDLSPDVMIVFAGIGIGSMMDERIKRYNLEERFFPLGLRRDLSSVFDHSDIYLNTYPVAGGLMCQFAARHGLPVLSLHADDKSDAEEFICQKGYVSISSANIPSLIEKAEKLIMDKNYRKQHGKDIMEQSISISDFNNAFTSVIEKKNQLFPWKPYNDFIPHDYDVRGKLKDYNKTKNYQREMVKLLGKDLLKIAPLMYFDAFFSLLAQGRLVRALYNNIRIFR